MKLVVGLGNPGTKYRETRHNLGFLVVDEVARRGGVTFESAPADALIARLRGDAECLLAKPLTFMNLSGEAVGALLRYYRIELPDVFIVADDANLPLGRLRARPGGSAGGHNGFKSVAQHLGTDAFARLRVGVGRGEGQKDLAGHVLGRFDEFERAAVDAAVARAADAVDAFVADGIGSVMNRFNADPAEPGEKLPDEDSGSA